MSWLALAIGLVLGVAVGFYYGVQVGVAISHNQSRS